MSAETSWVDKLPPLGPNAARALERSRKLRRDDPDMDVVLRVLAGLRRTADARGGADT